VIHTGGGHFLTLPNPMPRALEARGGLRHSELAGADGGRSGCPGELYRGRPHPSERAVGICTSWRCRACGASIRLDRATGVVRLDTSRPETIRGPVRRELLGTRPHDEPGRAALVLAVARTI
jgi:hypothetical protein